MSGAKPEPSGESRTLDYVTRQLRRNPLFDAAEIIARRGRAIGSARSASAPASPELGSAEQLRRRWLRVQLDQLRAEFWSLPLDELEAKIERLPMEDFPELQAAARRLQAVSSLRPRFPQLGALPGLHLKTFDVFRRAVVLPPQEAGELKEKFLRLAAGSDSLKQIKRSAARIQQEFPDLAALETDWLAQVASLRAVRRRDAFGDEEGVGVAFEATSDWELPRWLWAWAAIVLLRLLLRFLI